MLAFARLLFTQVLSYALPPQVLTGHVASLSPVLTGHIASLSPVLTGHVASLYPDWLVRKASWGQARGALRVSGRAAST